MGYRTILAHPGNLCITFRGPFADIDACIAFANSDYSTPEVGKRSTIKV